MRANCPAAPCNRVMQDVRSTAKVLDKMNDDTLPTLLTAKLNLLNTMANTSMLWWVSAVVFCATILGIK